MRARSLKRTLAQARARSSSPCILAVRLQFRWDPSITTASKDPSASAAAGASQPPSSAKPVALAAPEYMSRLLAWVSDVLGDEARFPTAAGAIFPSTFAADVGQIFRRLFRVYAHLYRHHLVDFERAGAVSHLNTAYTHFLFFVLEHKLVDAKDLAPLDELNAALLEKRAGKAAAASGAAGGVGSGASGGGIMPAM
jgi:hypothetical protein